jgi:SAM-dependent methyltransferase
MNNQLYKFLGERKTSMFFNFITSKLRIITSYFHHKQMEFEWSRKEEPRWFNHFSDQYYQFRQNKNSVWLERGVFNTLVINKKSKLLEIGCGDGFNTFHFFSERCNSIIAIDFDQSALNFAKKYNSNSKIEYKYCNILEGLPEGIFDNIIWDGSIEQFSESEINFILNNIKISLSSNGILSGYTAQGNKDSSINLSHNKREFESKNDLKIFLNRFFKHVSVFDTNFNGKVSLYFYASDSNLPFEIV